MQKVIVTLKSSVEGVCAIVMTSSVPCSLIVQYTDFLVCSVQCEEGYRSNLAEIAEKLKSGRIWIVCLQNLEEDGILLSSPPAYWGHICEGHL